MPSDAVANVDGEAITKDGLRPLAPVVARSQPPAEVEAEGRSLPSRAQEYEAVAAAGDAVPGLREVDRGRGRRSAT